MKKTKRKILALLLVVAITIIYVSPIVCAGRWPGDLYYQVYIVGKTYDELEMTNEEIEALNEYVKLQRCKGEDLYFVATNLNAVFDGNADLLDNNTLYDYCKKQYQNGKASYLLELLPESQYAEITATDTGDLITSGVKQIPKQLDKSTGELSLSDEYIEDIKDYLNYYVQQTQPYYIVPGKGANCTWLSSSNTAFNSVTAIGNVRRFCAEKAEQGYQIYSWNHDYYGKLYSDYFVARKADNLYFCKEKLDGHTGYGYHGGGGYAPLDSDAKIMTDRSKYRILGDQITSEQNVSSYEWVGDYFPADTDFYTDQLVFKTLAGLKEYLLSGKKETVYTGTVYNGDIKNINKTINYNTYVNTDWQKLNDQTYQKIVDAINEQGDNLSRKEIQKIIDDNIAEVTDAIEQSTGDVQKTLNRDTKKMLDVLEDNRTWLAAIYNSVKKGADTLENIESILNSGFNETVVCNMRTTHSQLDDLQTSIVSNSAVITKQLQDCYTLLEEMRAMSPSGFGELDAEKVENLLHSINCTTGKQLAVDSAVLKGIFGSVVDADGVVDVDAESLYDVLLDIKKELENNSGLMEDIRQLILDVKSRNININVTTPEDGDSIIDRIVKLLSPLTDELKDRFPFSLPWDIGICINLLAAEPEAPVLTYKAKVNVSGQAISGKTVIDFSKYEKVRKVASGFQTVLFAGILIALTRKMFMSGGGSDGSFSAENPQDSKIYR